jgi:tetratricopeptide (TPR) repeat protein
MYRRFVFVLLIGLLFVSAASCPTQAQTILTLPEASQRARVMQRIGLTDITIDYHRPLVNNRKIWGGLVPYGQVWRAGADENTIIEFTDPVSIEGQALAKGVYGLHMIPGENEWTIIFSKSATSWGSFSYDKAEDALRVTVKPHPGDSHEALTYDFDDVKPDSAVVLMSWEKLAVPFKIGVNVNEVVEQSLKNQLRGGVQYIWEGWDEAATYLVNKNLDLQTALTYSDKSIQNEERFDNLITKARVLDALNRKDDAAAARTKALAMANPLQLHGYGRQLQFQGKQGEAFEIFRANMKQNPTHWTAHNEAARLATANGDFNTAAKEMKLAEASAPDSFKPAIESLVKRLEAKEDINK